jgi:hypothetical protein
MFTLWHWFLNFFFWLVNLVIWVIKNPDALFTWFSKWVVIGWMVVHTIHWARVEYVRLSISTERKIAKIRQPVDPSKESAEEEE